MKKSMALWNEILLRKVSIIANQDAGQDLQTLKHVFDECITHLKLGWLLTAEGHVDAEKTAATIASVKTPPPPATQHSAPVEVWWASDNRHEYFLDCVRRIMRRKDDPVLETYQKTPLDLIDDISHRLGVKRPPFDRDKMTPTEFARVVRAMVVSLPEYLYTKPDANLSYLIADLEDSLAGKPERVAKLRENADSGRSAG